MIEVRLFRSELRKFDNEVHSSLKILEALREKKMPALARAIRPPCGRGMRTPLGAPLASRPASRG